MKMRDRLLSILLTLVMTVSLLPVAAIPARAADNPDPEYVHPAAPEVAILNAYTGGNAQFLSNNLKDARFNVVEAGKFGDGVRYSTKITDTNHYFWSGFGSSNLARLTRLFTKPQEIQAGLVVTRTSNTHSHYYWRSVIQYEQSMTSYMNVDLRVGGALVKAWENYDSGASTLCYGEGKYSYLPYDVTNKALMLTYSNSVLAYNGGQDHCFEGGSATGSAVCFYDGTAPILDSYYAIEILKNGEESTNFGKGDTIDVRLIYPEPLRFADGSASGKGNIYIALQVAGATENQWIYPHLTSLNNNVLTFSYTVPDDRTDIATVTDIWLDKAPKDCRPLIHKEADIPLKMLYNNGSADVAFTVTAPTGAKEGFTHARSEVTDMAGNSLAPLGRSIPRTFYVDCQAPFVTKTSLSASVLNYVVKTELGKDEWSDEDKKTDDYRDASDTHLGVGDFFSATLYMNEVVREKAEGASGVIVATTNVSLAGGGFVTLKASVGQDIDASAVGTQYGLGASKGKISVLRTESVRVTEDMSVNTPDGTIQITHVDLSGLQDLSGNEYSASAISAASEQFVLDTTPPTLTLGDAVQPQGANNPFYIPFRVQDGDSANPSGVVGLSGYATLGSGGGVTPILYAVTGTTAEPAAWTPTTTGVGHIDFKAEDKAEGAWQYLHIKPVLDGENKGEYNFAAYPPYVNFYLKDYAGNNTRESMGVTGSCALDTVTPLVYAGERTGSYDGTGDSGTLSVEIKASDTSGFSSVKYGWVSVYGHSDDTQPVSWNAAEGNLDAGENLTLKANATVDKGESFDSWLWVWAADKAGNERVGNIGRFNYSLAPVGYTLKYSPTEASAYPSVIVSDLQSGGVLVFDVEQGGKHYVKVADYAHWYQNGGASNGQIFRNDSDWNEATLSENAGTKTFTLVGHTVSESTFLGDFVGNQKVSVYSGGSGAIQTSGAITITGAAQEDEIVLRIAPPSSTVDNFAGEKMFEGGIRISASSEATKGFMSDLPSHTIGGLPYRGEGQMISSTLEGVQLTIDIGADKFGWDYADVDWAASSIELGRGTDSLKLGVGAHQTVTISSEVAAKIASGWYQPKLELKMKSGATYRAYCEQYLQIDATEPGSLALGVLAQDPKGKETNIAYDSMSGDYADSATELAYDPNSTIYYAASNGQVSLSVEALNAEGESFNADPNENGTGFCAGILTVVAWNTDAPNEKIDLNYQEHLTPDENGLKKNSDYYTGKRRLYFGEHTFRRDWPFKQILGVTANKDNRIALQVIYANGKQSDITYLTVHPVSLQVSGTVTTSPAASAGGIAFGETGKASVLFTPDDGQLLGGVTFYCREGYETTDGDIVPLDPTEEPRIMSPLGSGAWEMTVDSTGKTLAQAMEDAGGKPRGFYYVWAEDKYGNRQELGLTENAVWVDGSAPIVTGAELTSPLYLQIGKDGTPILDEHDQPVTEPSGRFHANFAIQDDSLLSIGANPLELTFSFGEEYARAIGATGEALTLTKISTKDALKHGENASDYDKQTEENWAIIGKADSVYIWQADAPSSMGITQVTALLTHDNVYHASGVKTFDGAHTAAVLKVNVEGVVNPKVNGTDVEHLSLDMSVTDAFGNMADPASVQSPEKPISIAPEIQGAVYDFNRADQTLANEGDMALVVRFNLPVKPVESWINRDIRNYSDEWSDAFPIWKDGTWTIEYDDIFGTHYVEDLTIKTEYDDEDDVVGIGEYGFDLNISTLEPVSAETGVVITAKADGGWVRDYNNDWKVTEVAETIAMAPYDEELVKDGAYRVTLRQNGDVTIKRGRDFGHYEKFWQNDEWVDVWQPYWQYDTLTIHINNIVDSSTPPTATPYFYFDEFKKQYKAGDTNMPAETASYVTVSYKTDRATTPVGDAEATFRYSDAGREATFRYYDSFNSAENPYTLTVKLSDYGITLTQPSADYADVEAPVIKSVAIWKQQGGSSVQASSFAGSASAEEIKTAFTTAGGSQQNYQLVVSAEDYSHFKVLVKSAQPTSASYGDTSDEIAGVSVSGNTVQLAAEAKSDFWIVVVDNAAAETKAEADNFAFLKIPGSNLAFDDVPPVIEYIVISNAQAFTQTAYIRATDKNNAGAPTAGVTLTGEGLLPTNDTDDKDYCQKYSHKLYFTQNSSVEVTATDASGNKTTKLITVSGIDDAAPVLTAAWSPCFRGGDESNPESNPAAPTAGPVKTDVVARVTSDKEITGVSFSDGGSDYTLPDNGVNEVETSFGKVEYNTQRVTVRFTGEAGGAVTLTVTAPNKKTSEIALALDAGVIDKTLKPHEPVSTALKREGYDVPYAYLHTVAFDEDGVVCMSGANTGKTYGVDTPFNLTVKANGTQTARFADRAGNVAAVALKAEGIDSAAPTITATGADAASSGAASVAVSVNEACTLSSPDYAVVECGDGSMEKGSDGNGNDVWTRTVTVNSNGTFRLTATDLAGNYANTAITVSSIDKTQPIISFETTTVKLRQDSSAAELEKLLKAGVNIWDNAQNASATLEFTFDAAKVRLGTPGIYEVPYSVRDDAGNVGEAVRRVKVIDKNLPMVTVDGEETEPDSSISIKAKQTHTLFVGELREKNEPYTIKLVRGIYTEGQLKRVGVSDAFNDKGEFTVDEPGFYTLYIVTQSRQSYRTLLNVEN